MRRDETPEQRFSGARTCLRCWMGNAMSHGRPGLATGAAAVPVMKDAATLLVRLPLRAGRRRLPAITPPETAPVIDAVTHIAQPAHVSSSSSDWLHLDGD